MTLPTPEPADVREARRAEGALRLAVESAEAHVASLRAQHRGAMHRVDVLIQMHGGQPELPVEEP